ncbi:alpha/beta hydrolase-fold protein [Streptomyces sp. ICBB 8177]|uniref:alpha/beta hydrolase n=1 Tax=Streptomyces sp. ICBB 8177 TaxID=563922 RepID=UPI000D679456|nr:alpha/beta hydrolase-fold protein [Streptomyces sp. ICBB 8177]PWI42387.1 hypothetical protein CK485_08395 [Streptomyces sp. ICBB 8177]
MSLTGTPFFAALIAATVLMVVGTLVLWSRVRGPQALRWLARLLMIVLCQLTAIGVVAVWINSSYGLYASWSDLLGTNTNNNTIAMPGPPVTRAKFNKATQDGVLDTYFHGAHSKLSGQVVVWTPPQYNQAKYRDYRFPVVMMLHGVPGSPMSWLEQGGIPSDFQQLMARRATHPFILVMPVVNPGGVDTDCSNLPDRQVATWLADDVPDLIQHNFRTIAGSKGWGVMGFSTGGFCAAKLPLQYPRVFGAGAALDPDPLTGDPSVIRDTEERRANAPTDLVRSSLEDVGIFVATSEQDRFSPAIDMERFAAAAANTPVRVKTLLLSTGGHNYGTWRREYEPAFAFLSKELAAPQLPRKPKPGGSERPAAPPLHAADVGGAAGGPTTTTTTKHAGSAPGAGPENDAAGTPGR